MNYKSYSVKRCRMMSSHTFATLGLEGNFNQYLVWSKLYKTASWRSRMRITPITIHDFATIQSWLSDESLFHLLAVEPLDYSKPFYLFVAREGESVIGWASVFNVDLWKDRKSTRLNSS